MTKDLAKKKILAVRFRVDFGSACSIGIGKIELLEGISRSGSLSAAARQMPSASTGRAPSSTMIRLAIRTVEKRCDTRMVMRPPTVSSPATARSRAA